jgi:hypothetical protein
MASKEQLGNFATSCQTKLSNPVLINTETAGAGAIRCYAFLR